MHIINKTFVHKPITFDGQLKEASSDGKRLYETPDGIFPSVTTVVGFKKQQFFAQWRAKNPEESKRVTSRGTKFHSVIEQYLKNEEYNENTNNIYYGQYVNIFNITLGILGLTYSIYSNMFNVNTKTIRGGRST